MVVFHLERGRVGVARLSQKTVSSSTLQRNSLPHSVIVVLEVVNDDGEQQGGEREGMGGLTTSY